MNKSNLLTKMLLLAVMLVGSVSAWADTYTNQASTVTYAFTSHTDLSSTNTPSDAFLTTNFTYGSNLNLSTFNTKGCKAGWAEQTLVYFKPTETVDKNAGEKAENMLEWTITPASGITFTPTQVSLTACTAGGTGDPSITIYAVYSDNSTETVQEKTNPRRPDKTDQGDGPSVYTKTLGSAIAGKFIVRAYFQGLTNTGKGAAITNVVITGTVSGTPVATTTYTITAATNDASLGNATGTATVAANENVTLTATPTDAGYFVKWQKDDADFEGNTANPLTVKATANATYTAIFEAKKAITFAQGEGSGTVPSTVYLISGSDFTIPESYFLYKSGATLTGWKDASENIYTIGETIENITSDITLTAQFTDNTVNLGDAATTVNWTFARNAGAPTLNCEGSQLAYVQHTVINETRFDAVMQIDTRKGQVIADYNSNGKLNNTSNETKAQVNKGTKFTIDVIPGTAITYTATNGTPAAGDITFGGENGSVDGLVTTYTYTGSSTGTLDIIATKSDLYPSGISVSYPVKPTKCAEPTITVGDFSFADKGYPVTITSSNTLWVSTDGETYTEQTSPYNVTVTETTTYYAKATDADEELDDSDVAEKVVTNTYDSSKKYVAWVYTKGYGSASYAFATDPMVTAMQEDYNVVEVNYSADTEPSTDLNNADLIVCTEAMTGNKTLSNGMKAFAGVTPMIGLKAFNYTKLRWSWGTPANPSPTAQAFTPKSALYKVLNGVTFESDGTVKLATATSGNVVQTVQFGTADCTAPDGNTIMGTLDDDDTKAVMYISTKYFGLGLSSDCWATYTENAVTIVKNAAAMLIAGEELDAEATTVSGKITACDWTTFSSSSPLDLSTLSAGKAYVANTLTDGKIVLTATTAKVPAGTGLMIKGTAGDTFTIDVTSDETTAQEDNMLVALPYGGEVTKADSGNNYVFGWEETSNPGFYLINGTSATLGAGKAYLHTTGELTTEARLAFIFDDETTGISTVESGKLTVDGYYNLNGQRVAQPTKGLYIVNGKKVVVK